jgi:hypothetical protein
LNLLKEIETKLAKKSPKVLRHIQEKTDLNIAAAFSSLFITLFIYDLQQDLATRIFEMFLLEGEKFLIKFLLRIIKKKEK